MPNLRLELVQAGRWWFSSRATVAPITQDQTMGLRAAPSMMFLGDADTPARWYFRLKAAHLAARQHGGALDHPLKGPVTLRWRS